MTQKFLNYGRQEIGADDVEAVVQVLNSDFLTQGPMVHEFEEALAQKVGAKYAVAVSSGTAALHIASLAAGIEQNDPCLTTTLTFVASANAIIYCGGKVNLADIDPDTLNLTKSCLESRDPILADYKVIIPVHFGGLAGGSERLRTAAKTSIIIEDASHSLGGQYDDGQLVGSCAHADMCVFSFHPVKSITTGEGGCVTTNDERLYRRLRSFANHGIERSENLLKYQDLAFEGSRKNSWYYEQHALGFNYRMSDIHAALGLSQLQKLERFVQRRREIATKYDVAFSGLSHVRRPQSGENERARSAHHLYVLEINFEALSHSRQSFLDSLGKFNVGGQVHYIPVHRQPYYQQCSSGRFPVADIYYERCLSLPIYPAMSDEDVDRVINAISTVIDGAAKVGTTVA